ncbi:bifunctional riboflavin kinase/FAD synthetase [Bdellovibrio reynosensis]|uniref:Riboflavin biosynthesis protein n=1 Tax=Bdellovibrio reynosensis TaxID=2835041 RepID=A0ABY4CDB3_9BACT|nr:bifunctional riboflavin kinase/FAD synthetase [Bdellovibrio reynosensis]UOF02962.1 bifunctional riboflavin kinase/FAD synthetase [Bdellovibrio reynosensis]
MHVYKGIKQMDSSLTSSVVTIGNFDGVHLGHQQLVDNVVREAQFLGVPSVVYTFHPHPVKVLHPERATYRLFDLKDQQERFAERGVENVIIEEFTKEFSKVTPQEFLDRYIFNQLHPRTLVVGHDFSFGADRSGNIPFLEKYCAQKGIKLIIIPPFQYQGTVVSSTRIRESLKNGDVESANELLGRTYYLRGHVEKGFQRGRTIGVPTANIHPDVEFMPRLGVYCTLTKFGGHMHPSITNIGVNPTFTENGKGPIKIETHLFDFDAHLYGVEVEVYLLHFIRDEMKFSGIEELKKQILQDVTEARRYFHEKPQNR